MPAVMPAKLMAVVALALTPATVVAEAPPNVADVLRQSLHDVPRVALPVPVIAAGDHPVIDGRLNDPCWGVASSTDALPLVAGDWPPSGAPHDGLPRCPPPGVRTTLMVASDAARRTLWIAMRCDDPDVSALSGQPRPRDEIDSADDTVELCLALGDDTATEFVRLGITPAGTIADSREPFGPGQVRPQWTTAGRIAVGRDATGWSVEMALPLDELTDPARQGAAQANRPPQQSPPQSNGDLALSSLKPAIAEVWASVIRRRWGGRSPGDGSPQIYSWTLGTSPVERLGRLVLSNVAIRTPALAALMPNTPEDTSSKLTALGVGCHRLNWMVGLGQPTAQPCAVDWHLVTRLTGPLMPPVDGQGRPACDAAMPPLAFRLAMGGAPQTLSPTLTVSHEGIGWLTWTIAPRPDAPPQAAIACLSWPVAVPPVTSRLAATAQRLALWSQPDALPFPDDSYHAAAATFADLQDRTRRAAQDLCDRPAGTATTKAWADLSALTAQACQALDSAFDAAADTAVAHRVRHGRPRPAQPPSLEGVLDQFTTLGVPVVADPPPPGASLTPQTSQAPTPIGRPPTWLAAVDRAAGDQNRRLWPCSRLGGWRLETLPAVMCRPLPTADDGAFRACLHSLAVTRRFDQAPNLATASLVVSLIWEPDLPVLAVCETPTVMAARDDTGRDLAPTDPEPDASPRPTTVMPGLSCRDWRIPLRPPHPAATALTDLRLTGQVVVAASVDRIAHNFADPNAPPPMPRWLNGLFVRLGDPQTSTSGVTTLTIDLDARHVPPAAASTPESHVSPFLLDGGRLAAVVWRNSAGRPMPIRIERERTDRRSCRYTLTVRPDGGPPHATAGLLTVDFPRTVRLETFNMGFANVPWP